MNLGHEKLNWIVWPIGSADWEDGAMASKGVEPFDFDFDSDFDFDEVTSH